MPNTDESTRPSVWLDIVLVYVLWLLLFALCIVAFLLFRAAVKELITLITGRSYADAFYYQASLVVGGLSAFIFVMGAESYLRTAVDRRQIARRFVRLVVPLAIIIFVVVAFLTLIPLAA